MNRVRYLFCGLAVAALVVLTRYRSLLWPSIWLLGAALYGLVASSFLYRPPEDHLGALYRLGRFHRFVPPDRWSYVIPWIDTERTLINLQVRQTSVVLTGLMTRDQVALDCEVTVTYRVDPRVVDRALVPQVLGFSTTDWEGIISSTLVEVATQFVGITGLPYLLSAPGLREFKQVLGTELSIRVHSLGLIVAPYTAVVVQRVRTGERTAGTTTEAVAAKWRATEPSPADVHPESDAKIRVLFLAADPSDASRLRLGLELREIAEQLQRARLRDRFQLEERFAVRPVDITQAMLDVEPHIVHFAGHGTAAGALCFEDQLGKAQAVSAEAMAALFEQFADNVVCVVLNACYSALQAKAIAEHVLYVIGMNQPISDDAAIAFAVGLYQALGAGRTVEQAYELGRVQVRIQGVPEHLAPVLLKKSPT